MYKDKYAVPGCQEIEADYQKLTDDQIRAKTAEFKNRYAEGETLEELLPEAFATVMNTSRRLLGQTHTVCDHEQVWDMVHFDVQLIGGMALNDNKIAEMATGEGETTDLRGQPARGMGGNGSPKRLPKIALVCVLYIAFITSINCFPK